MPDELKQAIKLIKSGEKQKGGQILAEILKTDPKNELAWLWMSVTVTNKKQQRYCLEKVIEINPGNQEAKQVLAELECKQQQAEPAPVHSKVKASTPGPDAGMSGSTFGNKQQKRAKPLPVQSPLVATTPKPQPDLSRSVEQKSSSNLTLGCLGGILAMGLGAGLWAIITVLTDYQIGWMAVGVGFLVGVMVKIFGRGDNPAFGVIGAVMAFFGCLIGNYLAIAVVASRELGIPTTQLVPAVGVMIELMTEVFHPMDVLFYGIAIFQGFRFSYSSR